METTDDQRYNARRLNAGAERGHVCIDHLEWLNFKYGIARVSDALRYMRLVGPRSPAAYLMAMLHGGVL